MDNPKAWSWPSLKPYKKIKPLGSTSPWAWVVEPQHGCNLRCGHCCAELVPEHEYQSITREVWAATFRNIGLVSPSVRVDLSGIVGEPTMNPLLTELLPVARKLAPLAQIQVTTNGTMLRAGKVNYKDMLDAGANIIYTDQYGPHEEFEAMAKASGYPWYQYYDAPQGAWSPWTYYGPQLKMIVLQDHPGTWPQSRLKAGLLGNWYGHLNWDRGKRFGMKPLAEPLHRRCNQPFLYVTVASSGDYLLCCQDGMHVTAGPPGSVLSGPPGFREFWYSRRMQEIRQQLRAKNRAGMKSSCAKCNVTFSRCDFKHWTDEQVSHYWNGKSWGEIRDAS